MKEAGVAAEINFHTNEPTPEFVRQCIEAGIPLTFGGDAHNLYEIGDFALHLDLVRRAGYDGDLADILLPWPDGERAAFA
jgi:histidinol phosphatase-like PHP family hydrolase